MVKRCFQIVVLALVGALLANAQCYAYCSTAACASSLAGTTAPCHHHQHGNHSQPESACLHHHFQLFGPESGANVAQQAFGVVQLLPTLPSVQAAPAMQAQELRIKLDQARPSAKTAFLSLSILRI